MKQLRKIEPGQTIRDWLFLCLFDAYIEARKGKRKKPDEHQFELNYVEHLMNLTEDILCRSYHPSPGIAFVTFQPVTREIFAAPFRDRIVHHFLFNACAEWWNRHFIADSFSCREGRGTLYAIERAAMHIRKASCNFTKETYIIKLDIQGYFMSLPRKKLYERVLWGLRRQYKPGDPVLEICEYLWYQVIFDDPTIDVKKRGWPKNWETLPPSKSLFTQPPGKGIVIGNLTSQLVSNIYLDQLDRYITMELKYSHYGRYVDDFFIIVPAEQYEQAKKDVIKIERYLKNELGLVLHPKKRYYQEVHKGMEFVGAKIYPHCMLPSNRLKKNFKEAAIECVKGNKSDNSISSYLGLMKYLDSKKITAEIFSAAGWEYHF